MKRQRPFPLPEPGARKKASHTKKAAKSSSSFQLPHIPGIPIDVLPLHLQSLRVCHDFVQRVAMNEPLLPEKKPSEQETDSLTMPQTSKKATNVLASVLERMDVASEQQRRPFGLENRPADADALRQAKDTMIQLWLQSIHRHVRSQQQATTAPLHPSKGARTSEQPVDVVPVAVTRHLTRLLISASSSSSSLKQQKSSYTKVSMRRAATYMIHLLLQKSSAARNFFCCSYNENVPKAAAARRANVKNACNVPATNCVQLLLVWMDALQSSSMKSTEPPQQIALLQYESYQLLQFLQQSFGHCYDHLAFALQRFQLQYPAVEDWVVRAGSEIQAASVVSMRFPDRMKLRQLRDAAMQYIQVEEQKVQKLLQQAYQCIDTLVPRLVQDGNVDDDDTIDWEDGAEDESINSISHLQAVELTMVAMNSIGSLPEKELAIDFGVDSLPQHLSESMPNNTPQDLNVSAHRKLQKIVRVLQTKHVPRLSAWENGLVHADDMIANMKESATSKNLSKSIALPTVESCVPFVHMSSRQMQQRTVVQTRVVTMQNSVASIISSARRLGVVHSLESP